MGVSEVLFIRIQMTIKGLLLRAAMALGVFAVARKITRKRLRILCYHGAEIVDEAAFNPLLFISKRRFEERMSYLASSDYVVLSLEEALDLRANEALPDYAVVLTVDDGWYGTKYVMLPVVERVGFPITLYLSTYYVEHQKTVWNVALDYIVWRHDPSIETLHDALTRIDGSIPGRVGQDRQEAVEALMSHISAMSTAEERQSAFERVCTVVGHDPNSITENRQFGFLSEAEVRELNDREFDIEMHTHRHRLSLCNRREFAEELAENRRSIQKMIEKEPVNFCYPSGEYSERQFKWLDDEGVRSATTTELGINGPTQSRFALRRILDSNDWDAVHFEYEMSGLGHLVRTAAQRLRLVSSNR